MGDCICVRDADHAKCRRSSLNDSCTPRRRKPKAGQCRPFG